MDDSKISEENLPHEEQNSMLKVKEERLSQVLVSARQIT
jgi:hypothetical protein